MDILSEKWMINRYLEFVNDSNSVYKIEADAGIKIRVHGTHITVFWSLKSEDAEHIKRG